MNRKIVIALYVLGVLAVAGVAAAAAKMTYGHTVHVGHMVGEPDAALLPVSIDGMVVAGTVMMAIDRLRGYKPRAWAVIGVWLGTAMLMASNIGSAWARGWWACAVSVIPAVTFFVAIEILFRPSRTLLAMLTTQPTPAVSVATVAPGVPVVPPVVPVVPPVVPVVPVAPVAVPVATVAPEVPAEPEPAPVAPVAAPKPPRKRAAPRAKVTEPEPVPVPPAPVRRRASAKPGAGRRKPTVATVTDLDSTEVPPPGSGVFEVMAPPAVPAIERGAPVPVPAFSNPE